MAEPRAPSTPGPRPEEPQAAFPREEMGPPFFATLTVGQGVDDHTAAEAGANPEAEH